MISANVDIQLKKILCIGSPDEIYQKIRAIIKLMDDGFEFAFLDKTFTDVDKLFKGEHPGYRASNTQYHNFAHTCAVTLATARLFHGHSLLGRQISAKILELGLLAAFFHIIQARWSFDFLRHNQLLEEPHTTPYKDWWAAATADSFQPLRTTGPSRYHDRPSSAESL